MCFVVSSLIWIVFDVTCFFIPPDVLPHAVVNGTRMLCVVSDTTWLGSNMYTRSVLLVAHVYVLVATTCIAALYAYENTFIINYTSIILQAF